VKQLARFFFLAVRPCELPHSALAQCADLPLPMRLDPAGVGNRDCQHTSPKTYPAGRPPGAGAADGPGLPPPVPRLVAPGRRWWAVVALAHACGMHLVAVRATGVCLIGMLLITNGLISVRLVRIFVA